MQKYQETGNENTATLYSAILKLYGKRTKQTIFYAYVKNLLFKDNLISYFRGLHLEATTEISSLQRLL